MIGQTLSHYRMTAALGAGGMGEVYRATDTNLGRDVAIKVLPPEVAQDPERLGRFKREAHLLAALNHPNIAAIHGLEEADGKPFLVLELVEGQDLKERLEKGAIPVEEALEIAEQVAEALEEAHDKGIVHRDLKPANVKLTPDGKVKVLDFGLAKAWAGEPGEGSGSSASMSQSPTLAHTGTVAGVILGTAAYMSPEQARGKPVDKRADVWSFGVLLWEMLTARALFAGDTVTDIIASVVKEDPDLDALPAETPRAVRRLIARCLRKDPRGRLPDIGAARLELQEVLSGAAEEDGPGATDAPESGRPAQRGWAWAVAGLVAGGLIASVASSRLTEEPQQGLAVHLAVEAPEGWALSDNVPVPSPDGREIAFLAERQGTTTGARALWSRAVDSLTPRLLADVGEPGILGNPFWSPDSRFIAAGAGGELRKLRLSDGTVQRVCALPHEIANQGSWDEEGRVLFSSHPQGGGSGGIYLVPAAGGEAQPLTQVDGSQGEIAHLAPQFSPDGRRFFFVVLGTPELTGLYVSSFDAPDERQRLAPGLVNRQLTAGRWLFVQDGTLLTQPYDPGSVELSSEAVPVASPVANLAQRPGVGLFQATPSGTLAYVEGEAASGVELVWFSRRGERLESVGKPGRYAQLALSHDERSLAVELTAPGEPTTDIWTIDVDRGVATRMTFDPDLDVDPVWSPDGRALVYSSYRDDVFRIYRKVLEGNEPAALLSEDLTNVFPESWSPESGGIVYVSSDQERWTLGVLAPEGDPPPETLLARDYRLDEPQVSPDGRWLAYISQESGAWEVYVEPYRRVGPRVRVSPEGGGQPRWRGDGKELFYAAPDGRLMAVEVRAEEHGLEVSLPTELFDARATDPIRDEYAVTADGQRFLVKVPVESESSRRIHVVTNWTSLLE